MLHKLMDEITLGTIAVCSLIFIVEMFTTSAASKGTPDVPVQPPSGGGVGPSGPYAPGPYVPGPHKQGTTAVVTVSPSTPTTLTPITATVQTTGIPAGTSVLWLLSYPAGQPPAPVPSWTTTINAQGQGQYSFNAQRVYGAGKYALSAKVGSVTSAPCAFSIIPG